MKMIRKREVLSKEDEVALFKAARDENASEASRKKAEEILVLRNMGLVIKEARRWASNGSIPVEDLIQEGAKGLVRAIQKFDIDRGHKFSTCATYWIKRDIGRTVRTSSDVIHVPEHMSEAARIAKSVISKFESEHGRKPTDEEFEKLSGMTVKKANDAFEAIQKTASIHTPVGDDKGSELGDLIEDQKTDEPDAAMARLESKNLLSKAVNTLQPNEKMVLALRYGVVSEPMPKSEIAGFFGVPEDAI